jgi:hypothetical protein
MKATVVYDDFMGTVAADIIDHTTLDNFIGKLGVDTKRYKTVRVDFNSGYRSFSTSMICIDKNNSTREKPYFVRIPLSSVMKYEDFLILFKRFKIELLDRFCQDEILNEEIIDLKMDSL